MTATVPHPHTPTHALQPGQKVVVAAGQGQGGAAQGACDTRGQGSGQSRLRLGRWQRTEGV